MSRPLALLKSASLTNARARQRHETLATTITLVDRLVTDAGCAADRRVVDVERYVDASALMRVADACARTRQALAERRWPDRAEAAAHAGPIDSACRRRRRSPISSARSSSSR